MGVKKAGYKGKVEVNGTKIGGATSWNYAGDVRAMLPIDEFEDEMIKNIPGQIAGGEITITGSCLIHDDAGQQLLNTLFVAGTEITDIKLYISKVDNIYYKPDPASSSYVTVVNNRAVGTEVKGVANFTCTLHVSGVLIAMGTSDAVQVESTGIHALGAVVCSFVGNLISLGGVTPVVCKFEYGTTISFGTSTTPTDSMTAVGLFEATSGTLVTATTYYWRAVATYGAQSYYGATKSFTTP